MINTTNNQITELSISELEVISGGGIFDKNRTSEEEAQEGEIVASLQESQKSGGSSLLDKLKNQAQAYIK
jgi:hypothetical protein